MSSANFSFDTTYTCLPPIFFNSDKPDRSPDPDLVLLNASLAQTLGLDFSSHSQQALADLFSGNALPPNATPFSEAYAGHQFGHLAQLGDGRAHVWGEHITPHNDRVDIQFKGSGQTPYSRRGDGKAVLGPMLREYIISEAMHALGIPTTRSLAVVTTGETIPREHSEIGAILTRVASSHIRVGTFEYAAMQADTSHSQALLDYTIHRHYPHLQEYTNPALALLKEVGQRQLDLVVNWMRVGFIHGVMNTDNMAISGETIDYGPCAFLDSYQDNMVFSSIDHTGRYAFGNQLRIVCWNLARFAEALLPLIDRNTDIAISLAQEAIHQLSSSHEQKWLSMMRLKLGLDDHQSGDESLIHALLDWMQMSKSDYTHTFFDLTHDNTYSHPAYEEKRFKDWLEQWNHRLSLNKITRDESRQMMQANNPCIIPRNHRVEEAIQSANQNNWTPLQLLLQAIQSPYEDNALTLPYQAPPSDSERVYKTFCGT